MNIFLRHVLEEIKCTIDSFKSFPCSHIYKERNHTTLSLSNDGLHMENDLWEIMEQVNYQSHVYFRRPYWDHFSMPKVGSD